MNMVLIELDMLEKMEHEMQVIKKNLKATQDRHKRYVDQHRVFKEFWGGENVYLHMDS